MSLDGIVTRALVHELQETIGARVQKIHQPTERDIVLQMRVAGANKKLLLSANPTYPRVHYTEQTYMNPQEPPMFCMLMRKHCEGGIIEQVEQVGSERVIHITLRQRDELGDLALKKVIVELTGRHSNIIVLDPLTNTIIDGIHHLTPSINSYRIVMPGFAYVAPPEQLKANPVDVSEAEFVQHWNDAHSAIAAADESLSDEALSDETSTAKLAWNPAKWLVQQFSGISPRLAEEIVYLAQSECAVDQAIDENLTAANDHVVANEANSAAENGSISLSAQAIWSVFSALTAAWQQHKYEPTLVEGEDGKTYFSIIPLTHIHGERRLFERITACMEAFYGNKAERDMIKQRVGDLTRFMQQEHGRNMKKLEKLQETLDEAQDADRLRIMGDLLFASLHMVQRGDKEVELLNYYDEAGGTIRITLDPLLSPSDNAQRYFKRYNKAKNSIAVVEQQMAAAKEENRYFETLLQQLADANVQDAQEIREELVEQGYLRDRARKGKKKKKENRPTLYCYTSSEGIPMYVGKNNVQNEYVTNRLAQPSDTWLHTKDIPGSHVVIRSEQYGDATLEEAAQLAAYFSQAKHSSQVPVDFTLVRNVRKPNGAKPGFVIYERQKTLYITPDADRIQRMAVSVKNSN
ncbi:Rqc2 family fibronectin-binding protein [Paenibacillus sp. 481]|uniref:Rqc2 family fibronectin-binding protein n=1 Tax=Paenibacillus sp. 481 TaxID=2835869 RepID=UPI001E448F44|nr:NFACT RNA binding domain-containing protein [Paenibacillus sp. 481]UHA74045.1 NFACT family protein [Paenibacillus sp. 481]